MTDLLKDFTGHEDSDRECEGPECNTEDNIVDNLVRLLKHIEAYRITQEQIDRMLKKK